MVPPVHRLAGVPQLRSHDASSEYVLTCEGDPSSDPTDWVGGRDWLDEAADNINKPGDPCINTGNDGSQYDWLRFYWDMLTDESNVSFKDLLDMYNEADPFNWDKNGSTGTTNDDPAYRIEAAASTVGISSAYDDQKDNGVYE